MKTRIKRHTALGVGLAWVLVLASPVAAFAEGEEGGGIDLLVPKTAELIPAIIAFAIVFVVLSKLVWPTVVKMMDDREKAIKGEFEAAEKAKEEAQETIAQSEEVLAEARKEADDIIGQAKDAAEAERNRILVEAHTQAAATIEQGHKVVENERQRAMTDLSRSVVDLSVDIAGKIIGSDLDEAEHRALAERLLDEMGNEDAQ